MAIIRWIVKKLFPRSVYRLLASKVYLRIWEIGWRLGITKFAMHDICQNERAIEYSWVLRNIDIENGNILDVGCKGSLFPVVMASLGFKVTGMDLEDIGKYSTRHPNFTFIQGDIRTASLTENQFNIITMISTIEHVGLENDSDYECMKHLTRLLADNGRIILTAPFGKAALFKRSRVYDRDRLESICQGLKLEKTEFFKELDGGKWTRVEESEVTGYKHDWEKVHCIVCLVVGKQTE